MRKPELTSLGSIPAEQYDRLPTQERFERVMKDKYGRLDRLKLKTKLPGIDNIVIAVPRRPAGQQEKPGDNKMNILIAYDKKVAAKTMKKGDVRGIVEAIYINNDGSVSGHVRPEAAALGVSEEDVLKAILKTIELGEVFEEAEVAGTGLTGDWDPSRSLPMNEGGGWDPQVFDDIRVANFNRLRHHPKMLFSFKKPGPFQEADHIIVYENCVLIENFMTQRAAYVIDTKAKFGAPNDGKTPPKIDEEAFNAWVKRQPWYPETEKERWQLIAQKEARIIHGTDDDAWMEKMRQTVEAMA